VAEDLIQRVGLNAMSYKHISDAVGIRKASIHHHFPKKKDMVDALLERCEITYGTNYRQIVDGTGSAPEKLRQIAKVFEDGVVSDKLCLVGMISSDCSTLEENSCLVLEKTLQRTIDIFSMVFIQGSEERSLVFAGAYKDAAYAYFSLLVGLQIAARVKGGAGAFATAAEVIISSWEA
jgi:TetR/AcrR family transcriptional repressor of nem operon